MKKFKDYISEKNQYGLYSFVEPDQESKDRLNKFCIKSFGVDIPDDVHCTVMYCTTPINKDQAENFSRDNYTAYIKNIDFWEGHDKKGYLVAKLVSPQLESEHNRLKKLGCSPTFDYSPHVTLISPFDSDNAKEKIAIGNNNLDDLGVRLKLINQQVKME